MEKLFELLFENPIRIFLIILIIVFIIVGVKNKNAQKNNGAAPANKSTTDEEIGDKDIVVKPGGWYRYQEDNQVVIKRNEEQQRIKDEYFVVENFKTTTCDSSLKKKAKKIKSASSAMLWIGIILGAIGIVGDKTALLVIGIISVVASIVCRIVKSTLLKRFQESIKVTVAYKKLMTDAEYEELVAKRIESMNIGQVSLDKLGLDPDQVKEIQPIILKDKVIKDHSFKVKNEKNGNLHSSTQHVTYLYFTDEQLFVYKIVFDMCCNMQEEWASEFFYKDICDVTSYTNRNVIKFGKEGKDSFEYSSVSFEIIASNSKIGFDIDGDNENVGSIQAMKQKIRERKAQ